MLHLLHIHLRLPGVQHVQRHVRLRRQLGLLLGSRRRLLRLQTGLVERLLLQRVPNLVPGGGWRMSPAGRGAGTFEEAVGSVSEKKRKMRG